MQTRQPRASFPPFTPTERRILELISDGLSNQEITVATGAKNKAFVQNRIVSIFKKLGASNRPQAVAIAVRAGVIN